ncbi:hypothetical protein STCU_10035 [Strigomonas culicis]|uniref:Uncharacterized protein n=1 Tax=Strigomonas culicis TaxID=28005 RepID=S9TJP1_9TRYP|nr:hypothetical protein STCU_10035 [Strigomonas culicis]|eukprot:EPY18342.1 hypothetical protein STCU_10035 [Strigomonas culicis]
MEPKLPYFQLAAVGAFSGPISSSAGDAPSREGNWKMSVHLEAADLRLTVLAGRAARPCPVGVLTGGSEKYVCRLFVLTCVSESFCEEALPGRFPKEPFVVPLSNSVKESSRNGAVPGRFEKEPPMQSFSCRVNVSFLKMPLPCLSEETPLVQSFSCRVNVSFLKMP